MIIESARKKAIELALQFNHLDKEIRITCRDLTPEEAIGNPMHDDYPIQKGKERMIEAEFLGKKGQAFTDSCSNYSASLRVILEMKLDSNAKRAVFTASLNAFLAGLGIIDEAIHCKNEEPLECSKRFGEYLSKNPEKSRNVLLVGLQPRLLEKIAAVKNVKVCDLDPDNIGKIRSGILIDGPEAFEENAAWADEIYATGSTFVNGTIDHILESNPDTCFYGVTIAGAAKLLNLKHYCHILGAGII